MKQFTLPKSERLYLRESIGELFANGKTFTVFPYRVVYHIVAADAPNPPATCSIMAVAPKKRFKHAVDRNHVKRLTREAYRLQKLPLIAALDERNLKLEVAFIYIDQRFISFDETYRIIGRAITKIIRAL